MSLTMYRNGSVYSAADPFATAMLVDGDVVAWVGSEHAAQSLLDSRMVEVNLGGALVAPGFVDSHVHLTETGLALISLDLSGAHCAQAVLDEVAAVAAKSGPGSVLLGHSWDNSGWLDPILPTAQELDRATGGREVYLARVDVHSGLVSSALAQRLDLAQLSGWEGSGLVTGAAHKAVRDGSRVLDPAQLRAVQQRALRHAAAQGYVGLAEMSAPHVGSIADLASLVALSAGDAQESLPQVLPYWGQLVSDVSEAQAVVAELTAAGIDVRGLAGDINIDGSLGSRSALLRTPYADAPTSLGTAHLTVAQAAAHLAATSALGLSGGFHVIGDGAMDIAVNALELAAEEVGIAAVRAAAHRFEHAEMVDDAAMDILAKYSVGVSVQAAFDAHWGGPEGMYARRLGKARAATLNPLARFYGKGVPVFLGSDAPVTPLNPWASIRAALNHSEPSARISARAAFIAHTRAGWRAAKEGDFLQGQLVAGAPASFAVWEVEELMVQVADERVQSWSTDPRARTPLLPALDTGTDPRCLQTVHRGRQLYVSENFS